MLTAPGGTSYCNAVSPSTRATWALSGRPVITYLMRVCGLVRATHLVAVVRQDVPEARPALLRDRDRRAEVTFHLETSSFTILLTTNTKCVSILVKAVLTSFQPPDCFGGKLKLVLFLRAGAHLATRGWRASHWQKNINLMSGSTSQRTKVQHFMPFQLWLNTKVLIILWQWLARCAPALLLLFFLLYGCKIESFDPWELQNQSNRLLQGMVRFKLIYNHFWNQMKIW